MTGDDDEVGVTPAPRLQLKRSVKALPPLPLPKNLPKGAAGTARATPAPAFSSTPTRSASVHGRTAGTTARAHSAHETPITRLSISGRAPCLIFILGTAKVSNRTFTALRCEMYVEEFSPTVLVLLETKLYDYTGLGAFVRGFGYEMPCVTSQLAHTRRISKGR